MICNHLTTMKVKPIEKWLRRLAPVAAACIMPCFAWADESGTESDDGIPNMTRTWTTKVSDSTIEATAIRVNDKTVTLRRIDNQKSVTVPLDKLGDEDLAWVEENKIYIGKSERELKSMALTTIGKAIKKKTSGLVDGKWKKKEAKPTAKYYIAYFSASWCPPCRANAPHSVEVYNSKVAKIPGLEVVMCNWDRDDQSMITWAEKENMPWPFLRGEDIIKEFKAVAPGGIPRLILVDGEGNHIEDSQSMEQLVETAKKKLGAADKK